jgi:hypothetical protein
LGGAGAVDGENAVQVFSYRTPDCRATKNFEGVDDVFSCPKEGYEKVSRSWS